MQKAAQSQLANLLKFAAAAVPAAGALKNMDVEQRNKSS